ncbi:MAG: hypothetical protein KC503_45915 [Myxococcales bacterium]|nr:hypothetical protein [Myxococcales bacterium]
MRHPSTRVVVILFALTTLVALPACDSSDAVQKDRGVPDAGGERVGATDGPLPDLGADGHADTAAPDAAGDARVDLPIDRKDGAAEQSIDAAADAADATVDAADATVDLPPPDTTADTTMDSGVCSPTSCGALNCLGVACSCIKALHGSMYLRTNGTVVDYTSQQNVIETSPGVPLDNVIEIYSGWRHGCALRANGTVWCWPKSSNGNDFGELGRGNIGGSVTLWTATQVMLPPATAGGNPQPLTGIKRLSTGSSRCYLAYTTCGVRQTDGAVFCWGGDNAGGGAGSFYTKGSVATRPWATQLDASATAPLLGVERVSLGVRHACALKSDRTVWCWGMNVGGPLGLGDQTLRQYPTQVTYTNNTAVLADDVGAGSDATCTRDGTAVWCWGANNSGQVGIGTPSDPANHDGCINYCKLKPKQVVTAFPANTPLANVQQLDVGYLHVCARLGDNSLWCWGSGGSNVAAQQLIQGNPINDNALWSTCSSSGLPTSLRRLSRDNVLRNPITVVPQMCP